MKKHLKLTHPAPWLRGHVSECTDDWNTKSKI